MSVPVGGSRSLRWAVAAAVTAVLGLTGCTVPVPAAEAPSPPPTTGPSRGAGTETETEERIERHEVSGLGKELDAALQSGDVEQWLAHFDLADAQAVQQQRDWFIGVHAVPMDVREVHATRMTVQTSTAVEGPRVELSFRHQVTGADPAPAVQSYQVHVERRGEEIKIVEVNNTTEGQIGFPQLWDLGPIEVIETGPLVVLTTPDLAEEVEEYLPALDEAAARAMEDFDLADIDRMVVTVGAGEAFDQIVSATGADTIGWPQTLPTVEGVSHARGLAELRWGGGFALRLHLDAEYAGQEWTYLGAQLSAGLPILRYQAAYLALILQHPDTLPPAWASEGLAGWYEVTGDPEVLESQVWWTADVLAGQLPEELPPRFPEAFSAGDPEEVDRNLAAATAVFLYVEDVFGWDAALELGLALNELPRPGADVGPVLREQLDLSVEDFEQGYLDWLDQTVAGLSGAQAQNASYGR